MNNGGYLFLAALGLMLIFEGMMPFLTPHLWKKMVLSLSRHQDRVVRGVGLATMLIGLSIILIAHALT